MLLTVCLSSVYIWTGTEHGRQIARLFVLGESGSEHVQYEQRNMILRVGSITYLTENMILRVGSKTYLTKNMILRVGLITFLTII